MPLKTNLGKNLVSARERYKKNVELISKGYYAPEDLPGGKVTVYPWDTTVDDWMTRRMRKVQNYEMLLLEATSKIADLKGLAWTNLALGDAWTILMVSRSMLSNFKVNYRPRCTECGFESTASVVIPDELGIKAPKKDDYPGFDEVTLAECKDVVQCRPLFVHDQVAVNERDAELRKQVSDLAALQLSTIVAINGTKTGEDFDAQELVAWFRAIAPSDAVQLRTHIEDIQPGLDTDMKHACDRCGFRFNYRLSITGDFFR